MQAVYRCTPCRLSCCVAGNQNLTPVEGQLKETLGLVAERQSVLLPEAEASAPPWLPHSHPLSHVEVERECKLLVSRNHMFIPRHV